MTYIEALDPNSPATAAAEARHEWFDENFPEWEVREAYGDTIVSEDDMPLYDASADADRVPNEDWEEFFGSRY